MEQSEVSAVFHDFQFLILYMFSTVAVALWAMEGGEGIKPDFQLTMDNVWQGGLLNIQTENPRWSADGREPS